MNKIKISAVSYTNTKPFAFGLQSNTDFLEKVDLVYDIPSVCAAKLIDNKVDIGLVPVAALLNIPDYHIISDYCIGAIGPVNSVFIFSNKPIEEVESLRLDLQSRTSNNLARVLLKNFWKKNPVIVSDQDTEADAFVEIGDRTFGKRDSFPYVYDLAEEWIRFTGLPFAFAVWASNKPIDQAFIDEFNEVLKYGLDRRDEVIASLPSVPNFDLHDYLKTRIDYPLTDEKREAIKRFHQYIQEL